jgi:transposase
VPPPHQNMTPHHELTSFAALDWACDHHDVVIVDRTGQHLESLRFEHTREGWQQALQSLQSRGTVAIAVETTHGVGVQQLLDAGLTVYPVVPKAAAHYRGRKAPSGVKDDQLDAWSLADALRVDGHNWHALAPADPLVSELRLLCTDEIALIEQRTALINQLQAALREYYPAALEAFEDWTARSAWQFIITFPAPKLLTKAGKRKWQSFLHTQRLWRPQTCEQRLEIFARADAFCGSPAVTAAKSLLAVSVAKMLLTVETQLDHYRERIEKLFADHPQSGLFGSLPGAGPKLKPRLLSMILHRTGSGVDAAVLQSLAGTAPVTFKSGQIRKCKLRRHCDKELRSTVHLWANLSRKKCLWAQTYYQAHRDKGQSHACALRCLAQRWLKILAAMCRSGKPYDEAMHLKNMTRHGSWNLTLKTAA